MTMTIERTLAEEAIEGAIEDEERRSDWRHVETFRHADGSATVIVYDDDYGYHSNGRDYCTLAALVSTHRDYDSLDDDDEGIGEVRSYFADRYDDRAGRYGAPSEAEVLTRRYLSIYRPDIVHYVHRWEVSGQTQGDWRDGFGYVTRAAMLEAFPGIDDAGMTHRAAEVFAEELKLYEMYFRGEVYGGIHLTLGAPIVTYGEEGAYVSSYEVEADAVWGFDGYESHKLADICQNFTDSPIVR